MICEYNTIYEYGIEKENIMKRHILNRHKACGLALALAVTSSLSLLTPAFNFGNSTSLFNNGLGMAVVAKAEGAYIVADSPLVLTKSHLNMTGNTITGLSDEGKNALANVDTELTTKYGSNYTNNKSNYKVILKFGNDIDSAIIGANSFKDTLKTDFGIDLDFSEAQNITAIKASAFEGCSAIKSVNLSGSIKEIGNSAFKNCNISGLLSFAEGLEVLNESAFQYNHIKRIKLPNSIKILDKNLFANNNIERIEKADWGTLENLPANPSGDTPSAGARRWLASPHLQGRMVAAGMFTDNKALTSVEFPDGLWAVGEAAFKNTDIRELSLPSNIKNLYFNAFDGNKNLTKLTFEVDADGNGIRQIDRDAFNDCSIEGEIKFPNNMNEMGGRSFANNKITAVDFGPNAPLIGYESFRNNPVKTIDNLNSWGFEIIPFYNTNALKNINFQYDKPAKHDRGAFGQSEDNTVSINAFQKGLLKSLKFPAYINTFRYDFNGKKYVSNAFLNNPGWTEGTTKVALYRVGTDGVTYVTDNAVDDSKAKDFVFNPVLLEFSLKDKDGKDYFDTVSPQSITIEGANNRKIELATLSAINFTNFKLGDKVTFTLSGNLPENYVLTNPGLTSLGDNKYELKLDPTLNGAVVETRYDDTEYNVGYMKTVITLTSTEQPPAPVNPDKDPTPVTPVYPVIPVTPINPATPINPVTPINPAAPGGDNNVIVEPGDDTTPRGESTISDDTTPREETNINDDTTPRGTTKKAKNSKSNKSSIIPIDNDKTPEGKLPQTGGASESVFILLGGALLGLGVILKKKFN